MRKTCIAIAVTASILCCHSAYASVIHHWDFSGEVDGTVLSAVTDSIAGVHFTEGLDSQAFVQNGVLRYTPSVGTFFASANVNENMSEYRWTVDFQSFIAQENAIGDGRRMHFGLYNSTKDILSNVHPTSSVAQVRLLSTNPPSDNLLIQRFTVLGDSPAFLDSQLDDFQISFLLRESSYEVSVTDNGKRTVVFSGIDTRPEDIASVQHFILSGQAFNGGIVDASIRSITLEASQFQTVPEPTTLVIWPLLGIIGLAHQRRRRSNGDAGVS